MEPIIDHALLASYLRPGVIVTSDDTEAKIELANGLVREILGDLEDIPVRAVAITLEAAARPLRATAETSVTTSSDNTSRTVRREGGSSKNAVMGVYLTPGEQLELQVMLLGDDAIAPGGIYTMDLGTPAL